MNPLFDNQWTFLLTVAFLLLSGAELGFRVGLRLHATRDEARRSQIGGVQAAVLGLLGLLLGFTFAMAVSRYDMRRQLVLKEANSIGTAWLRAGLLPDIQCAAVKDLLSRYVAARLKYEPLIRDPVQLAEGLRLCAELQMQLWQRTEAVAAERPTPITALFISAINDVIDADTERIAAARNRIPSGVWTLLIIVAAGGCFTTGYGSGAQGARSKFTNIFLPALITVVVFAVFDLTHSHQGIIGVSQQPLVDLQRAMRGPQ